MKRSLQVCLGDRAEVVGQLRYEARGAREASSLEYDAAWLEDEGAAFEHEERKVARRHAR